MKFVVKRDEPLTFSAWKAKANQEWQPTYTGLQNPEKRVVHEALLSEQGYVCCYCGRRIDDGESHIEHFRPQAKWPDLAIEYGNLFASCIRTTTSVMPLHCGHRKGDCLDEMRCVSPTDAGCEQRFSYTLFGEIFARDDVGNYMSDLLGLDIEFLRNRREDVLKGVFDDEFLMSATVEELTTVRDSYRESDNGRLPDFGHVVARYAEQLLCVL